MNLIHALRSYLPEHLLCDVDFFSFNDDVSRIQRFRWL
jgi:hypothetical protein